MTPDDTRRLMWWIADARKTNTLMTWVLWTGWTVRRHPDRPGSWQVGTPRGWCRPWGSVFWAFRCAAEKEVLPSKECPDDTLKDYRPSPLVLKDHRDWSFREAREVEAQVQAL
jgi:hypothetical protein